MKYCFTSQKPASFTCDRISEPAPVASTNSSRFTPGTRSITGATIPAPVMVATVAEPVAMRITAATSHASMIGEISACTAICPITLPTPVSTSICLKPPPAPTISTMAAVGARLWSSIFMICWRLKPRAEPKV
ncbi:hypothetical protein D3C76_1537040 [compost metagenome]